MTAFQSQKCKNKKNTSCTTTFCSIARERTAQIGRAFFKRQKIAFGWRVQNFNEFRHSYQKWQPSKVKNARTKNPILFHAILPPYISRTKENAIFDHFGVCWPKSDHLNTLICRLSATARCPCRQTLIWSNSQHIDENAMFDQLGVREALHAQASHTMTSQWKMPSA